LLLAGATLLAFSVSYLLVINQGRIAALDGIRGEVGFFRLGERREGGREEGCVCSSLCRRARLQ